MALYYGIIEWMPGNEQHAASSLCLQTDAVDPFRIGPTNSH